MQKQVGDKVVIKATVTAVNASGHVLSVKVAGTTVKPASASTAADDLGGTTLDYSGPQQSTTSILD